ncbi:hypothetical protein Taro_036111, partial [Colocasia esculenta]|nr:hypothetical protein [Colocasia esculenta]
QRVSPPSDVASSLAPGPSCLAAIRGLSGFLHPRSRLSPSASSSSSSALRRWSLDQSPLCGSRAGVFKVRMSSVPESAGESSFAAETSAEPDGGGYMRLLHLGVLFVLWILFNIYFNIYNKQVLKVHPYPITITAGQFAVGTVFVLFSWAINLVKKPRISSSQLLAIVPLAIVHTLGNLLTNVSLGKVAVSFTHTIKAMEPFFSVMLSAMFIGEVSLRISDAILIGFAISGATCWWGGIGLEALDNVTLFSVITIMSFILMVPVTLLTEGVKFTPSYVQSAGLNLKEIYVRSLLSGICFHAYQQVAYMILAYVSPVTLSVGNNVKRVVVIVSAVLFFRTPVSPLNSLGSTGIALAGVFLYSEATKLKARPKLA